MGKEAGLDREDDQNRTHFRHGLQSRSGMANPLARHHLRTSTGRRYPHSTGAPLLALVRVAPAVKGVLVVLGTGAVFRFGLTVVLLVIGTAAQVNAQASGVLQARVRVLPGRPGPAARVISEHAAAVVRVGRPLAVDPAASRARVELRVLPDSAGAKPSRLRATVTYLR
jgi:hypothetical protein